MYMMIDLESLGTKAGCSLLSGAAVVFNPTTGERLAQLEMFFQPNGTPEWDTVQWWSQQAPGAMATAFGTGDKFPLSSFPPALESLWREYRVTQVWAWGPADFFWLHSHDLRLPWPFREERCLRTLCFCAGVEKPAAAHGALADCQQQIDAFMAARKIWNA